MRMLLAATALAALTFASSAFAAPVAVEHVSYSPAFQTSLNDDLGPREGEYLSGAVTRAVERALAARGATLGEGGVSIELSILDADPNRPTLAQLSRRPGLDISSVSVGGAELHAVLRGADGQVLTEVNHRRYDYTLDDFLGAPSTWEAAHRAIQQFANKVADAYVAQTR